MVTEGAAVLAARDRTTRPGGRLTERQLVERCLAGDDGAWRELVERY